MATGRFDAVHYDVGAFLGLVNGPCLRASGRNIDSARPFGPDPLPDVNQ